MDYNWRVSWALALQWAVVPYLASFWNDIPEIFQIALVMRFCGVFLRWLTIISGLRDSHTLNSRKFAWIIVLFPGLFLAWILWQRVEE